MRQKLLLITPPFTQLNTPYPATAYLKGFLNTKGIASYQLDLGIEVILDLFSVEGLKKLFATIESQSAGLSENSRRILALKKDYLKTIGPVIGYLQDDNPTLGHLICEGNYLPEANRFTQLDDLEWAFGTMGVRDKARHLATLYLEDLSDLIVEAVDPHFGFSRYAERLGRSASTFDGLQAELRKPGTYIDEITLRLLQQHVAREQPTLVALSVPFPGNLYSAFTCGQWLKEHHPGIKIVMGGGFANTELRSLTDARVFDYVDYICLDDGEAPIENLLEYLEGERPLAQLKRTFACTEGKVVYYNGSTQKDYPQRETGTPDYSDLPLHSYLSVIEIVNPMHRLWSDGRWNKLTLAHGCYWGKCTFCDVSLDYIKRYEPLTAKLLCDRIEEMIAQTGQNGFHFVDEAAPPALLRELALEILRRELTVVWWTNIRFEKSFTADLCRLLKESGCIAISGGLEVASDRLLALIQKGVTIAQVAKVAENLTEAGIMVHAYLMYGFPTQTAQETIDSLEVVRQLFQHGIVQSGFWHQFAMTAHSPVGLNPALFGARKVTETVGTFANNDIYHQDPSGADHEQFSEGLKKSLFNYMHGLCFDYPLQQWFDFKVPRTTVPQTLIQKQLAQEEANPLKATSKIIWLGNQPQLTHGRKRKKGKDGAVVEFQVANKNHELHFSIRQDWATWLQEILPLLAPEGTSVWTYQKLQEDFQQRSIGSWERFWYSQQAQELRESGLLVL
ncbi:radical SAM protein [Roseivirga sp. BDSF3-8]|uniref:B12-binding domain-containing radical SAM protein n=1 Tax=Roseivirga sp. BDSF3-8 TaxID=3241598 RepID=UPI0035320C8A